MSYEVDKNPGGSSKRRNEIVLSTTANATGRESSVPKIHFYELEPAIVVKIILDSTDSREVGGAIVRQLVSDANKPDSMLPTAYPLDSNIKSYPIPGEIVIVAQYGNKLYYTQRLNFYGSVNSNNVSALINESESRTGGGADYSAIIAGNPNSSKTTKRGAAGKYFKENLNIMSLHPMEGDIIHEGRFGNSIRLGGTVQDGTKLGTKFSKSTWSFGKENNSPIIIIRNGQDSELTSDTGYDTVIENINTDHSSIYLTSDQLIGLKLANNNFKSFGETFPNKLDGAQTIITSDRIILNAKLAEILLISAKSIGLSSGGTLNIDTERQTIINSPQIQLGLDATEALVLGNKMVDWMKDFVGVIKTLLDTIQDSNVLTGTGPSSTIRTVHAPKYSQVLNQLSQLENSITTILSKQNKTL